MSTETTLGPLNLGDNILLRGLQADRVAVDMQRSDSGVAQILVADVEGGEALELYGWYTFDQVEAVLALSAGKSPVLLVHPRFTGLVLIQGTSNMEDVAEYVDPYGSDYRAGSINLLRIS